MKSYNISTYENTTEEEKIIICHMNILSDIFDLFNAHNLDYRGLINKGLAIEAPEGMYRL